jgi:hypothetical protein
MVAGDIVKAQQRKPKRPRYAVLDSKPIEGKFKWPQRSIFAICVRQLRMHAPAAVGFSPLLFRFPRWRERRQPSEVAASSGRLALNRGNFRWLGGLELPTNRLSAASPELEQRAHLWDFAREQPRIGGLA